MSAGQPPGCRHLGASDAPLLGRFERGGATSPGGRCYVRCSVGIGREKGTPIQSSTSTAVALIVEDNDKNLKLARDLLQIGGFSTIEAGRAEDGVRMAREHRPDVVVMDIQLPDFDGWEALRRIRSDPDTEDMVVVAVTAFAVADDESRFLDGGFNGYLTKPIDVRTFSSAIRTFCMERSRKET